jgi:hypothetical protein
MFSYGEKDYYLGGSPIWQLFRIPFRMLKQPYILGGMALLLGYCWAALTNTPRAVSPELMRFHRREQHAKLRGLIGRALTFRRIDPFHGSTA